MLLCTNMLKNKTAPNLSRKDCGNNNNNNNIDNSKMYFIVYRMESVCKYYLRPFDLNRYDQSEDQESRFFTDLTFLKKKIKLALNTGDIEVVLCSKRYNEYF